MIRGANIWSGVLIYDLGCYVLLHICIQHFYFDLASYTLDKSHANLPPSSFSSLMVTVLLLWWYTMPKPPRWRNGLLCLQVSEGEEFTMTKTNSRTCQAWKSEQEVENPQPQIQYQSKDRRVEREERHSDRQTDRYTHTHRPRESETERD